MPKAEIKSEVDKMSKTLAEFERELKEGKRPGVSQYAIRNENLQSQKRTAKIGLLKKEKAKRCKFLAFKEIAIPWNPVTGQSDETYNENRKFRPTTSVTSTIKLLKQICNKYPEAKDAFMSYAGVDEWDSNDETVVTKEDYAIFAPFIQPRVFTIPVIKVNIPAMGTGQYGKDYKISVEHDPVTGAIVGEWPLALQANSFMRAVAFEELAEYNRQINDKIIDQTEQQKKDKYAACMKRVCISDELSANYLLGVEVPLGNSCDFREEGLNLIRKATKEQVSKQVVLTKFSAKTDKGIRKTIEEYKRGELARHDLHYDYWEIDVKCPIEIDEKNKGQIGLDTTYEKPEYHVGEGSQEEIAKSGEIKRDSTKFDEALIEYMDSEEDIERRFLASIHTGTVDEAFDQQLLAALPSVIDLSDEYITDRVILSHKNFISLVFGSEGDKLIAAVEEKLSGRKEGSYSEEAQKAQETKAAEEGFNVDDILAANSEIEIDE